MYDALVGQAYEAVCTTLNGDGYTEIFNMNCVNPADPGLQVFISSDNNTAICVWYTSALVTSVASVARA